MTLLQAQELTAPGTSRAVGQPIHEIVLTDALKRFSSSLLPPGLGRSVVVIPEVAIGRGRPDILFVVVSMTSLNAYIGSGLRVETLTDARTLMTRGYSGTSESEGRKPSRRSAGKSWTNVELRRYSTSVIDSLAVEAKMKDWKQAIRQASRFRHLAHRAAIMLPESSNVGRVEPYLRSYDLGFVEFADGRPRWRVTGSREHLDPGNNLWLLELAAREIRTRYPQLP